MGHFLRFLYIFLMVAMYQSSAVFSGYLDKRKSRKIFDISSTMYIYIYIYCVSI